MTTQTARIEFALIAAATLVAGALAINHDAFEALTTYVEQHDSWELDEVIVAFMVASVGAFVLLFRRAKQLRNEIHRREASEGQAIKLARQDPLTGLANRRVLEDDLKVALARVAVSSTECAVLLIDLDRFKPINDLHGHTIGDAVLVELARRLSVTVANNGTVARMGGDEFACVIPYSPGTNLPARLAEQIVRTLREPVRIGELELQTGASIGIACAPRDGMSASDLLHGADLAMYETKRDRSGSYRFFDAGMGENLRERIELEKILRQAIKGGEIIPHFQPVMNLATGGIIGFEALARWSHATRGPISPEIFIPVAEDLGIIDQITYSMFRLSCAAACEWPTSVWLSVNISPVQLKEPGFASRVLAILHETGFPASRLILEITENALICDIVNAQEVFAALQKAGVRVAIDDFGKGYSSLYHLRELQFDQIKIDRSFIRSMECAESAKIVGAVASLGKAMGMPVTAEGVETQAEADALRALGCEHAQGFLFGKAAGAAETRALLEGQERTHPVLRRA